MILRDLLLGGLLLPFKLYFQPGRFIDEIANLTHNTLTQYNRGRFRNGERAPGYRRAGILLVQPCVAILWAFALAGCFSLMGFKVQWASVWSGAALGVASGIAVGFAISIVIGVTVGFANGAAIGIAIGIAVSIAVGVPGSFAGGVTIGTAEGLVGRIIGGVTIGIAVGIAVSVVGGIVGGAAEGVTVSVIIGIAVSIVVAMAGGLVRGVVVGTASVLTISHLLIYPMQICLSGLSGLISRAAPPPLLYLLWRLSPVHWDEIILLPLPGLSQLLAHLNRSDAGIGKEAVDKVSRHYFQYKSAYHALGELAFEEARQLDTLPALSCYERGLDWLTSDTPLTAEIKTSIMLLKEVSQIIDAAAQSNTTRNKSSQLRLAEERIQALRQNPGKFGPILIKWRRLISEGVAKAEEERRSQERIRQVYFNDGVPISPDELAEEDLPFKGRLETVRELEGALSNTKRATLLLTGSRRSGKSSLLLQLPRKLGPQVLPAFLDCQSAKFACSESAKGLLEGLAEEIMEQARRNVEKFRRDPIKFPRMDLEWLAGDPYRTFARWLDGTERALGGRQLLLCLDEFEKLEEALAAGRIDERFLSLLRNIIQHHHRIIVLLSGSYHLDELPPRWADALVTTQSLKIGFLNEADARELILRPVKDFPEIYQPAAVDRILALTHSQPYLVQLLCGLLVEKMNKERREPPASYVTPADIETVIPQALERGEAYFIDLWRSQTGGNIARRVLEKLAFSEGNRATRPEIKQLTEDEEALRDTVRTLLRREIVELKEDGYRITVPLVAHYIRLQQQPV